MAGRKRGGGEIAGEEREREREGEGEGRRERGREWGERQSSLASFDKGPNPITGAPYP